MDFIADKYQIIRKLGDGGSGVVYLVKHRDLGVEYALKVLNRSLLDDKEFIDRFKVEASVLQRFTHPGSVQLRDFGRTEVGRYYLAMDYCVGESLKDVLESEGPYHIAGALGVAVEVAAVLQAAHDAGIIHSDIKPANIIIQKDEHGEEQVKVLDFGTALLKENIDPTDGGETLAIGTPCYMAPEQAAGSAPVDHSVDIYSLGIVLYEMLTGEVPFEGEDIVQTLLMHITQPPLPFSTRYGIPEYIQDVVFKAIAKKKQDRYGSAGEFLDACVSALERYTEERKAAGLSLPKARNRGKANSGAYKRRQQADEQQAPKTKVLCLDDDEMILNIMKHILEAEGYEVYTALDCSAIHEYLFNKDVRLLVSDVQMPGLSGVKVCRMLKKTFGDLKVVLFSNLPEKELKKCSKEGNADGWISKHMKPNEWVAYINEVLEDK